uniref:Coiled-coil domain-containing protein 186 n=1 Tax=Trichuris muris TaxID=70415 RepID=A0A5S6QTY3_TRIMR
MAFEADVLEQKTSKSSNCDSHDFNATITLISEINNALNGSGIAGTGVPGCIMPSSAVSNEDLNTVKLCELYTTRTGDLQKLEVDHELLKDQYHNVCVERDDLLAKLERLANEHSSKVQQLEKQVKEYDCRIRCSQDRIVAQEAQFHRLICEKEGSFAAQMQKLVRSAELAQREKDNAVVRYAQREKDILVLEAANQKAKQEINHLTGDQEALRNQLIAAKNDRERLVKICERKDSDLAWYKRELDRLKNGLQEADVRVKVAYQKAEENEEANKALTAEISALKSLVKIPQHETCEEGDLSTSSAKMPTIASTCCYASSEHCELKEHLLAKNERIIELEKFVDEKCITETSLRKKLENLQAELKEASANLASLEAAKQCISEAEADKVQAEREACQCRQETERLLQLVERLTESNTIMKTENLSLSSKLESMENAENASTESIRRIQLEQKRLVKEVDHIRHNAETEIEQFRIALDNIGRSEQELSKCLSEELNSNRVQKKKQAIYVKELKAEIAVLRKRLEQHESSNASQSSGGSVLEGSSRAPSPTASASASGPCAIDATVECYDNPNKKVACEHNQAMIEKIVKLQRAVARRNEKIEFLEENVKHLAQECRKKTRIIQAYVTQIDVAAVASEYIDSKKLQEVLDQAEIAKRGSTVMSNLFGSGMSNKEINLELALEMMRKFQVVLEDTLLKNVILKENVQTLGQEISRLSQENCELKLRKLNGEHVTL